MGSLQRDGHDTKKEVKRMKAEQPRILLKRVTQSNNKNYTGYVKNAWKHLSSIPCEDTTGALDPAGATTYMTTPLRER